MNNKKEFYGEFCITARVGFSARSEKSIEELKQQLLEMGFGLTFYDEDSNEISSEEFEVVELEGQIIDKSARGYQKEEYTEDFEIYECEYYKGRLRNE